MIQRPCRCLLSEMPDEAALTEIVRERIAELPEEERAEEPERKRRLSLCRECVSLNRGTCILCGCYVEIRAVKKRMGCPNVPPRW